MRELITPQMIRETARWSQSDDDLRETLRQAAAALEYALSGKPVDESGSSAGFFISTETPAPAPQLAGPADQIVSQIEELFPNWRAYRDLIDCITCELHELRKDDQRDV